MNSTDLKFYCVNYYVRDVLNEVNRCKRKEVEIYCIGRLIENNMKCVVILSGLRPCLYLRLPGHIRNLKRIFEEISNLSRNKFQLNEFINPFKEIDFVDEDILTEIVDNFIVRGSLFYGFRPVEEYFLKLEFTSMKTKRDFTKYLLDAKKLNFGKVNEFDSDKSFQFYHSHEHFIDDQVMLDVVLSDVKLDPILQFFHEQDIRPSSTLLIKRGSFIQLNNNKYNVPYVFKSNYKSIISISEEISLLPLNIMSFDCEMNSHHGDFPQPKKKYFKFCKELLNKIILFKKNKISVTSKLIEKCVYHAFSLKEYSEIDKDIGKIFTVNNEKPSRENIMTFVNFIELRFKEMYNTLTHLEIQVFEKKLKRQDYTSQCKEIKRQFLKRMIQITETKDPLNGELIFPRIRGDEIIQIGIILNHYRKGEYYRKILLSLHDVDKSVLMDTETFCFDNEKDLLLCFRDILLEELPDIIIGYNIFTFDWSYIYARAEELNILNEFSCFSFLKDTEVKLRKIKLSSAGLGENHLSIPDIPGITQIDMLGVARQVAKLDAYDLSSVSNNYIYGKILLAKILDYSSILLVVDTIYSLHINDFININYLEMKKTSILSGKKFTITFLSDTVPNEYSHVVHSGLRNFPCIIIQLDINAENVLKDHNNFDNMEWGLCKDDVTAQNIFSFFKKDDYSRGIIGKYCIKDCLLVTNLLSKLDVVINNIAMSNVCIVPLQDLFTRGQGRKFFSLTSKFCRNDTIRYFIPHFPKANIMNDIPDTDSQLSEIEFENNHDFDHSIESEESDTEDSETEVDNTSTRYIITNKIIYENNKEKKKLVEEEFEGYEGAIVLEPKPDLYTVPIVTLDFGSLYPSSIIDRNLSHDTCVIDPRFLGSSGGELLKTIYNLDYEDISYDNYVYVRKGKTKRKYINEKCPQVTCRFIQPKRNSENQVIENTRGLIPRILQSILSERKKAKKAKAKETDPFRIQLMESTQLAYKLTANSGYGTIGASVSELYFKDVAACTTAIGRSMLNFAKKYVLENYPGSMIIYGDTDSVFVKFHFDNDSTKENLLQRSLEYGFEVEHGIQPLLRYPHVLEFEKVYFPYYLFSKKKYAGYKYESDIYEKYNKDMSIIITKFKKDFNGIAPKRRDSCVLAKTFYLDTLWTLFNTNDIVCAYNILQENLQKLVQGNIPLDNLIVTKTLKSFYENPDQIGHKVLADRLEEQGLYKFMPNDRIPFIFIDIPFEKTMISDTMEHPDLVKKYNKVPDYIYYIENQLGNNIAQLFYLIVEKLPQYTQYISDIHHFEKRKKILNKKYGNDDKKITLVIKEERMEWTKKILFDSVLSPLRKTRAEKLRIEMNKNIKQPEISTFYSKQTNSTNHRYNANSTRKNSVLFK